MTDSEDMKEAVALRFRAALLADRARGLEQPVAEYLERFPKQHWDLVIREYLEGSSEPEASAEACEAEGRFGPYCLISELGRGGQGAVYLAEDTRLGRRVALKLLRSQGSSAQALLRFRREAQVASRLEHPGICSIHDAGMEDGIPYIAMRYVKGETLAARIADARTEAAERATYVSVTTSTSEDESQSGEEQSSSCQSSAMTRVELDQILELFESAARALHAAHEAGVVHRDIKPGNIMVTPEGEPVILDFGLAHDEVGDLPSITATGDIFGTPAYMSPEQIAAKRVNVDRRTDVYSLGVVLFECLTLRRPFEAPTREGLYQAIMTKEPPDPRRLNKSLSRDLLAVLQAALEKDCDRRYQTAEAFAQDLEAMRELRPVQVKPIGPVGRLIRWSKRRPYQAASLVLLFIVLSAGSFIIAKIPEYRANRQKAKQIEDRERQERAEGFLQNGFQELQEKNNLEAITEFQQALELSPQSTESIAGIVVAHLALEDPLAALGVLRRYEQLARTHRSLQSAQVEALRAAGRETEAAKLEGTLATATLPSDFFFLGYLEMKRGKEGEIEAYARAVDLFTLAVRRSPRPRQLYYVKRAGAASRAKDVKVARECAGALIAVWPRSSYAWCGRGYALFLDEDRTARIAAYRKAAALRPDYLYAWTNLGRALRADGRLEDAVVAFRKAVEIKPDSFFRWTQLARALESQGKLEDALAARRKALEIRPDYHYAWHRLGIALQDQGRLEDAVVAWRKAVEIKPDFYFAWDKLAWAFISQAKLEDALAASRKALEIKPDYHFAWHRLGIALQDQGRLEEAVVAYRKVVEIKSEFHLAWCNLGLVLQSQGKLEDALAAHQKAVETKPDCPTAWGMLGQTLQAQGKLEDALAAGRKAVEITPDDCNAWNDIGLCLTRLGRHEDALRALEECLKIKPDSSQYWYNKGNLLFRLERYEDAVMAFEACLKIEPDHAEAHTNLGLALEKNGELDEAIAHYREAIRLKPDFQITHENLIVALGRIGDSAGLLAENKRWVETHPDDASIWADFAVLLLRAGRRDEDLADLEAAIAAAKKAVVLTKEQDPKMLQTLGLTLAENDEHEEAVTACENALKIIEKQKKPDDQLKADLERALKRYKRAALNQ